jgi:type II secretory pathway component PulK
MVEGRVNVNTAPAAVLGALGVFTEEEVSAIIAARADLDDEQRGSVNWLTSTGAVSPESFAAAAPYLTTKAEQFTIESVGYANHTGVVCRLQVVVEMLGQSVPRIVYFRDISSLGSGYPVRQLLRDREKREKTFGRTRQRT